MRTAALVAVLFYLMLATACSVQKPSSPVVESSALSVHVEQPESVDPGRSLTTLDVADFELEKTKQCAIWNAEHATFEIELHVGGRLKRGLAAGDVDQIQSLLRNDFKAKVLSIDGGRVRSHSGITETIQTSDDTLQRTASADDFVTYWKQLISRFATRESLSVRVITLFPSRDDNELWNARLLVTVFGKGNNGEMLEYESEQQVVLRFARDEELATEPVLVSWVQESRRQRSTAQQRLFQEVTVESGLDQVGIDDNWKLKPAEARQYRFQMAVADYDRDGWLDLAVAEKHDSRLLRWHPKSQRFVEVTKDVGIRTRHTPLERPERSVVRNKPTDLAGWIDYDNDGFPDLVLGNRLYHNKQGSSFEDVTEKSSLLVQMQSMGVVVFDYDVDGRLDLYILQQASGETPLPNSPLRWVEENHYGEKNRLWRNLGDGRFQDVTDSSGASGGTRHSLAGAAFFYDDDHLPDLYIANDLSKNVLLRNRGDGTFEDVSDVSNTAHFATSMGVAAGDIDNNGTSDLYVAYMFSKMGRRIIAYVDSHDYPEGIFEQIQGSCSGNCLYRRAVGSSQFTEHGEKLGIHNIGWAYAPALADFDNDGWLDIYATTGFLSFDRSKPDG